MRPIHIPRSLLWLSALLSLIFVLAACGSNATRTGSTPANTPTPVPTAVKGYGTAYGCPSDAVVTNVQNPNVTVKLNQANSTITAQNGNIVEVQLPFGQKWTGPTNSQSQLVMQTPAGFAMKDSKMCVWRFLAKGTGTTQLSFTGQAICKPGQMCPQYVLSVPFTIDVK